MGIAIVIAIALGVGIGAQVAILGRASATLAPLTISLGIQAAGLIAGAVWAMAARPWSGLGAVVTQWWWLPLGILGFGIVAALGFTADRLGVSITLAIVVAAQVITGLGIDRALGEVRLGVQHFGGVVLLVVGVLLVSARS